jgi:DME family drug/metabolite transporter
MQYELGVALSLASMLCFAFNIMVVRTAVARLHPDSGFFIVLAVNVVAGALIFTGELLARTTPFVMQWREAAWFAFGGMLGAYLGRRVLLDAVAALGPARASVFHSCAPVPTLLFAWIMVGETLGLYELALMAMVLAGLWITQPPPSDTTVTDADRVRIRRGALLAVVAITGFAASNAVRGYAVRIWNEPFFGALVGAMAAFVLQVVTTRNWPKVIQGFRESRQYGYLAYFASGLATLGGAILLISAARHMEITLAVLITHTTPVVVFPVSVFVFKNREGLKPRTFVGVLLVLAGITLLAIR